MPTWREIQAEERAREQRRLQELGAFGRLIDNTWTYVLLLVLMLPICFGTGLLIGIAISWR